MTATTKDPILERLANTELALNIVITLLKDTLPASASNDITEMMYQYFEAQESWNSNIYKGVEFSVNNLTNQ